MTRSLRWRLMFGPRRYATPVVSAYMDRLREKAFDGHVCQWFPVTIGGGPR